MKKKSCIGLVTVLFNCEAHLPLFFQCMASQSDRDFLIIVIDNASNDASLHTAISLANRHNLQCEFIPNSKNLGIAFANNQGVERARELGIEHIVLINNDISCEDGMIGQVRKHAIGSGHRAWTCLAFYRDTAERWYGGGYLSYWLARGIHLDQQSSNEIKQPVPVSYAPTCLMYLHATVFDSVGKMDPEYFVYYDDTDFCMRLQKAGIELVYDPNVSFRHYVGGSSGGELSSFFLRMSTRNKFIYIRKHYSGAPRLMVTLIAIVSKLTQLMSARRRKATWAGLVDALHLNF